MNSSDDSIKSAADLKRAYGVSQGEAERVVSRFSRLWSELDILLAAKGRTRTHRTRELRTPAKRAPYGLD